MSELPGSDRVVVDSGEKIDLVLIEETDFRNVWKGINDPAVTIFVMSRPPTSEPSEREWFSKRGLNHHNISLGIATRDGLLIGNLGLHDINWINQTATGGAVIWNKDYWDKGYGMDAEMTALKFAFYRLNLRVIAANVWSLNPRSAAVIKKCGGQHIGTRRGFLCREGKYYDELLFTIHREDWEPRWTRYQEHVNLAALS